MNFASTILCVCLLSAASIAAQAKNATECIDTAFAEYTKAMSPLISSGEMSVETQLTRRRLAENYCLKWVHCLNDGPPAERDASVLGTMFSSCLNDGATLK
jgi:hypothetical protein